MNHNFRCCYVRKRAAKFTPLRLVLVPEDLIMKLPVKPLRYDNSLRKYLKTRDRRQSLIYFCSGACQIPDKTRLYQVFTEYDLKSEAWKTIVPSTPPIRIVYSSDGLVSIYFRLFYDFFDDLYKAYGLDEDEWEEIVDNARKVTVSYETDEEQVELWRRGKLDV